MKNVTIIISYGKIMKSFCLILDTLSLRDQDPFGI